MTAEKAPFEEASATLRKLLVSLEPYMDSLVLVGGWVPYLYRYLPWATPTQHPPVHTSDIDMALSSRLVRKELSLGECLERGGFGAVFSIGQQPPVMYFQEEWRGLDRLASVYAEFLVPHVGRETGRSGESRTVVKIEGHGGVTAQALRFLDLLLEDTLEIDLQVVPELGFERPFVVRIPHPLNYCLQKLLAIPRRSRNKVPGDCAYLYEVAVITRKIWPEIRQKLAQIESSGRARRAWVRTARGTTKGLFLDEVPRGAQLAYSVLERLEGGEVLPPEGIEVVMRRFLEAVGLDAHLS
jgi:hypothetical protein